MRCIAGNGGQDSHFGETVQVWRSFSISLSQNMIFGGLSRDSGSCPHDSCYACPAVYLSGCDMHSLGHFSKAALCIAPSLSLLADLILELGSVQR